MHLVDDIHFVMSLSRAVSDLFADLTDIVHAVVGCGIDLDHVHRTSLGDRPAGRALSAGVSVHRRLAVDRLREYLGEGRLACTARAAEQIGMADPSCSHLIAQGLHDCVLTFDFLKNIGTEFSV